MKLVGIRRGKKPHEHIIYAQIKYNDGELAVGATLAHCLRAIVDRGFEVNNMNEALIEIAEVLDADKS